MYPIELHSYMREYFRPYKAFAQAWSDVNLQLLGFIHDNKDIALHVKYEKLIHNPVKEVTRLLEFLGVSQDAESLIPTALGECADTGLGDWKTYREHSIHSESIGRGQKELSQNTVNELYPLIHTVMNELQYPKLSCHDAPSPREARRLHQLRHIVSGMETNP